MFHLLNVRNALVKHSLVKSYVTALGNLHFLGKKKRSRIVDFHKPEEGFLSNKPESHPFSNWKSRVHKEGWLWRMRLHAVQRPPQTKHSCCSLQ